METRCSAFEHKLSLKTEKGRQKQKVFHSLYSVCPKII